VAKRAKQVKNEDISDVENWLKALEDGKIKDFLIRDPHLLRAIGRAQTDLELVKKEGSVTRPQDFRKAEWNVIYAVSTALDKGETWYGVARTLGISSAEAKERFGSEVERLKVEREQIAEEQKDDYPDAFAVPFEDLSEEDQLAAGRLADAIAEAKPVDKTQIREGGYITVVNKFDARYEDRILRVLMNEDGQLERVLLAGPPNHWISFSTVAGWEVDAYEPPVYQQGWAGWATVETELDKTERMFGMWVTVRVSHEDRLHFVASENGRFYMPADVHAFDRTELLHPGPLADFQGDGAKWLYKFGLDAQGAPEEVRVPWDRIAGKQFYFDLMTELLQILKNKLS
jgi:hypothetical protein